MVQHILPLIPSNTQNFVELFCGSAVVSLNIKRARIHLNDLDGNIYNFFKVLRNEELRFKLCDLLSFSPFDHKTFTEAEEAMKGNDPLQRAWGLMVRNQYSFGHMCVGWATNSICTGARTSNFGGVMLKKRDFISSKYFDRFIKLAQIDSRDALEVLDNLKGREKRFKMFFYADPPYPSTDQKSYEHKYTMDDFENLLKSLSTIKEHKFLLSCFKNDVVEQYANDNRWYSKSFKQSSGAGIIGEASYKTEMLYANYPINNDLYNDR